MACKCMICVIMREYIEIAWTYEGQLMLDTL